MGKLSHLRKKLEQHDVIVAVVSVSVIFVVAFGVVYSVYGVNITTQNRDNVSKTQIVNKLGGSITYKEGSVEFKEPNGGWFEVEENQDLGEGMSVRTLEDGRVIITLDDGSVLRLASNSLISLDRLDPNHIVVSNIKGEVYSRVVKSEREFDVLVEKDTYKALGTAYLTLNTDSEKGVDVYHSKVQVEVDGKEEDEIVVEEGKKFRKKTKDQKEMGKIVDLDVNDLEDGFVKWNKEQDEQNKKYKEQLGVLKNLDDIKITIYSPKDGSKLDKADLEVKGSLSPIENVKTLYINGKEVKFDEEGKFDTALKLTAGDNKITVKVINQIGSKYEKAIKVSYTSKSSSNTNAQKAGIYLQGSSTNKGISLNWNVTGLSISEGFKIVYSKTNQYPTYGKDSAIWVDPAKRSFVIGRLTDGKEYYIRVGRYLGNGKADYYSNTIRVKAPYIEKEAPVSIVKAIELTAGENGHVSWIPDVNSVKGYKVVWSKNSGPTYPTREGDKYHYISNGSARNDTLTAFDGTGTYYVRVCEYLGGKCGTYSNEVEIEL